MRIKIVVDEIPTGEAGASLAEILIGALERIGAELLRQRPDLSPEAPSEPPNGASPKERPN